MSGRKFGILTVLLILTILFCVKGTAMSMGNGHRAEENFHYLVLEEKYVRNAKEFLNGQGLDNCGVMMTRVTNEDGSREYTVRVHHRRLEGMSMDDKMILKDRLSQEEFDKAVCIFQYDL